MADQYAVADVLNRVLPPLIINQTARSYEIDGIGTYSDRTVSFVGNQTWEWSGSVNGPWSPVPAFVPWPFRVAFGPLVIWARSTSGLPGVVTPSVSDVTLIVGSLGPAGPPGPVGPQGPAGVSGGQAVQQTAENRSGTQIWAGAVLAPYSTGGVMLAAAHGIGTRAIAVAAFQTDAFNPVTLIIEGPLTLLDWTLVSGSTLLSPGVTYYLDPSNPGMMTSVAPSSSGQFAQQVGEALNANTMLISIHPPILL